MEMEEREIVRSYLQAADRKNQIVILSELNLCSADEITDILSRHGALGEDLNPAHAAPKRLKDFNLEKRMFLYNLGKSDREIADELGISTSSVKKWRGRRNLPPNRVKEPYESTDAKQLWMSGKNDTQIAEARGVTPSAVCQWRKRNGLHRNAERRWVPKKGNVP